MNTSPTTSAVLLAILAATPGLTDPTKARKADAGAAKYTYASLADFLPALRAHLATHGLVVSQGVRLDVTPPLYWREERRGQIVAQGETPAALLVTRISHAASGEWVESAVPLPLCYDSQDGGSALTYSRRYGILSALGMAPEDDDDGKRRRRRDGEAGEKAARQEQHDPSWTEQERKAFCAAVERHESGVGVKYEDIAAWLVATGNPRPSSMTRGGREALFRAIRRDGPDRPALDAWLAGRDKP